MNDLTGQTIGPYRIEQRLGKGGMGVVYQAAHLINGRVVAIKVMHDYLAEEQDFQERFIKEAQTLGELHHPHIVAISGYGVEDGRLYLAMELVTGGTLRDLLPTGPADAAGALPVMLDLVRQAADGLDYACARGIIHRDIKPDNLLLQRAEQDGASVPAVPALPAVVKISDFGLVRLASRATLTARGPMGSPAYMAPERFGSEPIDGRSDIYALGVILYEAVAGALPFRVTSMTEAVRSHLFDQPRPPRELNEAVPAELEAIILRCLAKRPEDRFATAADLSRALRDSSGDVTLVRTVAPGVNGSHIDGHGTGTVVGGTGAVIGGTGAVAGRTGAVVSETSTVTIYRPAPGVDHTAPGVDSVPTRDGDSGLDGARVGASGGGVGVDAPALSDPARTTIDQATVPPPPPVRAVLPAPLVAPRVCVYDADRQRIGAHDLAPGAALTVGRAPESDLILDSPRISDHHLTLTWDGTRALIADAGSRNGAWLDGTRFLPGEQRTWHPTQWLYVAPFWLSLDAPNASKPVPHPATLVMTLDPKAVALTLTPTRAGDKPVTVELTLSATGSQPVRPTITVEGATPSWVTIAADDLRLNPGDTRTIALQVLVPRSPENHSGVYPVVIRAHADEAPQDAVVTAAWTVAPFYAGALALVPVSPRGWRRGAYAVRLANNGNAATTYTIAATDSQKVLRFSMDAAPTLTIPPGETPNGATAEVPLTVQAPGHRIGKDTPFAFVVTAQAAGDAAAPALPLSPAQGMFMQRALLPSWAPIVPVALIALVVLLLKALPSLGLSAGSLDFASLQLVQRGGAASPLTITNRGLSPFMARPAIGGPDAADFRLDAPPCLARQITSTGCAVNVTFSPRAAGPRNAILTVSGALLNSPQTLTLRGIGVTPRVSISRAVALGEAIENNTTAPRPVTLTNGGSAPLSIGALSIADSHGFGIAPDACSQKVLGTDPNNRSCTFGVVFRPASTGPLTATLTIPDDALDTPQQVTLTGVGVIPVVTLNPASLAFGPQPVRRSTTSRTVTIANSGTADLRVSAAITGVNRADFSVQALTCPSSIAPHHGCAARVSFTPGDVGPRAATLVISNTVVNAPTFVPLQGSGLAPEASLTAHRLDFAPSHVGVGASSEIMRLTLANTGTLTLLVRHMAIGGGGAADFTRLNTCGRLPLDPGDHCVIAIGFAPRASGQRAAWLSIDDNAPDSPQRVILSGSGVAAVPTASATATASPPPPSPTPQPTMTSPSTPAPATGTAVAPGLGATAGPGSASASPTPRPAPPTARTVPPTRAPVPPSPGVTTRVTEPSATPTTRPASPTGMPVKPTATSSPTAPASTASPTSVPATPTATPTPMATATATATLAPTDTVVPTSTNTATDTALPTSTDTAAPTSTDTAPTSTNTAIPSPTDTALPSPTDTASPTPTPP